MAQARFQLHGNVRLLNRQQPNEFADFLQLWLIGFT